MTQALPAELGTRATDFVLKDVHGELKKLANVRGRNGMVVVFICNHCPYVKAITVRLGPGLSGEAQRPPEPLPRVRPQLVDPIAGLVAAQFVCSAACRCAKHPRQHRGSLCGERHPRSVDPPPTGGFGSRDDRARYRGHSGEAPCHSLRRSRAIRLLRSHSCQAGTLDRTRVPPLRCQ